MRWFDQRQLCLGFAGSTRKWNQFWFRRKKTDPYGAERISETKTLATRRTIKVSFIFSVCFESECDVCRRWARLFKGRAGHVQVRAQRCTITVKPLMGRWGEAYLHLPLVSGHVRLKGWPKKLKNNARLVLSSKTRICLRKSCNQSIGWKESIIPFGENGSQRREEKDRLWNWRIGDCKNIM